MIVRDDVDSCRKGMSAYVGRKVRLKSSGGRKRTIVQEGILENCYPNVFTVRCNGRYSYPEMISYSYVDVLTRVVEIAVEANSAGTSEQTA
ncbi:MAG: Veg family protein [Eubacteriales bacterium]|nr:Veg family protein [Eubacteriales bacterium]MDD4326946.1 Veg family protein [Eubacteriales bacterium]MDD4716659.1 Veg family protein [Eubacteriales bacterium]NCU25527.1 Veg protein [Candidatus Nomurabacteria bacterium]